MFRRLPSRVRLLGLFASLTCLVSAAGASSPWIMP